MSQHDAGSRGSGHVSPVRTAPGMECLAREPRQRNLDPLRVASVPVRMLWALKQIN